MLKRIGTLLLTLLLLLGSFPARAANNIYNQVLDSLYNIILRTDEGDVVLGSGALFLNKDVILAAESCWAEGALFAVGSDGEHAIQAMETLEKYGAVLLQMDSPAAAEPLLLANMESSPLPYVFGCDAAGNVGTVALYHVLHGRHNGHNALMLSAEEGLMPGGFAVDEMGALVALAITQHAEGLGMYIALGPEEIYAALVGDSGADQFFPVTMTYQDGFLNINWTDEDRSSGVYVVTLSGDDNSYYTTYEVECAKKSMKIVAPPGHTYYVQVQWAEDKDKALPLTWSAMTPYTVQKDTFSQYLFTQECYLATAPVGVEVEEVLPETGFVLLADETVTRYLQIINRYDVDQEIEYGMSLELIAPDGQFYFWEHLYLFSPEFETDDCFALPLDELLATCVQFSGGQLQPGEYLVRYSIAGKIAGECAFTIE